MSKPTIIEVSSHRFAPSLQAYEDAGAIQEFLGLDSRADAVRLSIGFSLRFSGRVVAVQNSQGTAIRGETIFGSKRDEVKLWIALICTYECKDMTDADITFDFFRKSVSFHWGRGAEKLVHEIVKSGKNYTAFLGQLAEIANTTFVPEHYAGSAKTSDSSNEQAVEISPTTNENEVKDSILKELREFGIKEISEIIQGPRTSRYKINLFDTSQYDQIRRKINNIAVATGVSETLIDVSHDKMIANIDIPRHESSWKTYGIGYFNQWINEDHITSNALNLYLGVDMFEKPQIFDLAASPHLLIAGSTGGGKSTCLHAIICSLIRKKAPDQLKLALIDPKQTELTDYRNCSHLFQDQIATHIDGIEDLLQEVIKEMESRNSQFAQLNVRDFADANTSGHSLPYIVVVIDELANLFIDSNLRERFEPLVAKLATMGRSSGIHLIGCTQRPDSKTIDGQIRQNLTSKIALKVNKKTESRIIMEEDGAEQLLGKGDMWVKWNGQLNKIRIQGVYLSSDDVRKIVIAL